MTAPPNPLASPPDTLPTNPDTLAASHARRVARGERIKFLYFWGHRPERDGRVGSGCLSQWWPAAFTVEGRIYPTAEHYMMWRKAKLFGDDEAAERILAASHPQRAKALGRQVHHFDQRRWEEVRYDIVVEGNVAKFSQHADLHRYLMTTGERVLVEASPLDRVWGIGLAADDERAADPARWRGLNLLGFALMRSRAILREHSSERTE
ncbi:NADAR family protein [Micromonospora polyrhachis]|uniref:NADAR domain-containing protein n=1 Tax=Micromonospora polyrhachis TaxID=1282883 RepID=A0A7W7SUX5_9ACTN|nr:hypothetical protein [Micromonospora polyrhachis]